LRFLYNIDTQKNTDPAHIVIYKMNTLLMICPYSPVGSSVPALGAAKKISLLSAALKQITDLAFVNTANNVSQRKIYNSERCFPSTVSYRLALPCLAPRPLGRFLHVLTAPFYGIYLGIVYCPMYIWIYNQGAGEMLLGYFAGMSGSKIINEIEDLPFSRQRGRAEIKPYLDTLFSKILGPRVDDYMFVSNAVRDVYKDYVKSGAVVNGLISVIKKPRSLQTGRVGYFGGFYEEKGADILLGLLTDEDRSWPISICGGGDYLPRLVAALKPELGDRLWLNATDDEVDHEIAQCNVLLNPHAELFGHIKGVFPFKLVEYINSSAFILSTDMGFGSEWLTGLGIIVLPRTVTSFREAAATLVNSTFSLPADIVERRYSFLQQFVASSVVAKYISFSKFAEIV